MLKIRLSRTGKKNQAHYRIVISEKRSKRDGDYVANLGHYIPYLNPAKLKLDIKSYDEWVGKGAQPTEVVSYLRKLATSDKEIDISKKPKTKKNKHKQEAVTA